MKRYGAEADCKYKGLSYGMIQKLHNNGIKVNVWTLGTLESVYDFDRYGVDYITTNSKLFY